LQLQNIGISIGKPRDKSRELRKLSKDLASGYISLTGTLHRIAALPGSQVVVSTICSVHLTVREVKQKITRWEK
jgi:hypothetical protein